MTSHPLTESWYARAREDADLRDAIELELGKSNVVDLLWWREHPDLATPDGTPSPFSDRDELKRLVYAKTTSEKDRRAAAAALQELDEQLAELTARIDAAIVRVNAPRGETAPASASAAVTGRPRRAWPRVIRYGAIVVGAFTAGLVAATTLSPAAPAQQIDDADAAPIEVAALEIFETGRNAELTASELPATFDAATAVQVSEFNTSMILALRNTSGQACLAALEAAGGVAATCVSDEDFPELGLRLTWSEQIETNGAPPTTADFYAIWMPDGTVTSGGSDRQ